MAASGLKLSTKFFREISRFGNMNLRRKFQNAQISSFRDFEIGSNFQSKMAALPLEPEPSKYIH